MEKPVNKLAPEAIEVRSDVEIRALSLDEVDEVAGGDDRPKHLSYDILMDMFVAEMNANRPRSA
jgi:hypothetical protein